MENKLWNYWLVSGEVIYSDKDEVFHRYNVNGIIKGETPNINVRGLANAQKVLQINFHQQTKNEDFKVVDCIIFAISPLGFMTDDEFQVKPEEEEKPENSSEVQPMTTAS